MKKEIREALEIVGEIFGSENPIVNPHRFSENAEHCYIEMSGRRRTMRSIRIFSILIAGLSSTGLCLEGIYFPASVIIALAVVFVYLSFRKNKRNNNNYAMAISWRPYRKFLIREFKARGISLLEEPNTSSIPLNKPTVRITLSASSNESQERLSLYNKKKPARILFNHLAEEIARDKVYFEYHAGEESHPEYDEEKDFLSTVAKYCGIPIPTGAPQAEHSLLKSASALFSFFHSYKSFFWSLMINNSHKTSVNFVLN